MNNNSKYNSFIVPLMEIIGYFSLCLPCLLQTPQAARRKRREAGKVWDFTASQAAERFCWCFPLTQAARMKDG
jgi:hypothetical protein